MIIGLAGLAGTGKDTAADYLVQKHGFVKLSFASALKRGLNAMFGFDMEQWEDREWKEKVVPHIGKSPRQLAQTLGTEWGRACVHENIWPNLTLAEAFSYDRVVIADVRFDNEADAIRNVGELVHVRRFNAEHVASHSSEDGVAEKHGDFYVFNNLDKKFLFDELDSIVRTIAHG